MCGGGVCSILLMPLVARCLETIDVCIWCMSVYMYVCCSDNVGVYRIVYCVATVVKDSVCIERRGAAGARAWEV